MTRVMIDRPPEARTQRLVTGTRAAHERLDARITNAEPFRDRAQYGRLLRMHYRFHRDIDALYELPLPIAAGLDLPARRRLDRIRQDLDDLGLKIPEDDPLPLFPASPIDPAGAIGWIWVAEGSNLGAAVLLKRAFALGLGETFGARHLAGHPGGRAAQWRELTAAVNALELDDAEEARLAEGARAAFARVHTLADESFA
jgi:heme oxygenase